MFTPQYKSTKSSGRVERLAQEHDTMNRPGFAFALLLQRSSAYYTHQTRILRRPFPSPQQHQELLLIATVTYFSLPPPMPYRNLRSYLGAVPIGNFKLYQSNRETLTQKIPVFHFFIDRYIRCTNGNV